MNKTNPINRFIPPLLAWLAVIALAAGTSNAANITWGSAQNISADTDVSLSGTLVRAANLTPLLPQTAAGNNASFTNVLNTSETVNGVTFAAQTRPAATASTTYTLANGDVFVMSDTANGGPSTSANQFAGFGGPSSAASSGTPVNGPFNTLNSVPYQRMLSTAWWNDGATAASSTPNTPAASARYTITLNGLTIGKSYQLQVWVNDSRLSNLGEANPNLFTTFSDGTTSVDLQHNVNDALGGIGQFAIGTFTADATSQSLTMTGGTTGTDVTGNNVTSLLGAYQLRDISSTIFVTGGGGVCPGGSGVAVGLSGSFGGYDYQLQRDSLDVGSPLSGTGAALNFGLFTTPGLYTVTASNTTTTVVSPISGSATVVSNEPPAITTPPSPASGTNSLGELRLYSVSASGTGLTYQWRHAGTNITNGNGYSGATNSTLTINPVAASHAGNYDCVVSGACTPSATSSVANLVVKIPANLTWVGGGANLWDTSTANWTGDAATFANGDSVTINDSGNNTVAIDLVGTISPVAINATNNAKNFTIGTTTTGSLGGTATLTKRGTGKLTLTTSNSFVGKTTVTSGTLSIDHDSKLGAIPGAVTADQLTLDGGALEFTATDGLAVNRGTTLGTSGGTYDIPSGINFTNRSVIAGAGGLTKISDGTLTLNALNTFTGNMTVNAGVASGPVTGGPGNGDYIGVSSPFGAVSNTRTITINNGGILSFDTGNIFAGGQTTVVAPAPHIIVNQGGTLRTVINDGNNFARITLNGGLFSLGQGHGSVFGAAILTDTITVGGASASTISGNGASSSAANLGYRTSTNGITFDVADATGNDNADLVISVRLRNAASTAVGASTNSLVKTGAGTLSLEASPLTDNEYTGLTVISNGTLRGTATILGSVEVYGSGKIGGGSDAGIGTLSVGGSLTFNGGGAYVRVDRSGPSSDSVSVTGTLVNNGTGAVTVNNLGAALQVGDAFTIFSQPVVNGNTLSVSGAGVTWTNKLAIDGTIQVLSLAVALPPSFPPGGVVRLPDGNISLTATGAIGATYKLWASTNVALTPVTNTWTLLSSGTVTVSPFTINDLTATNYPRRFYLFSAP